MADRTRRNAFINENIGEQMNSADREAGSIEQMLTGRYLVAWSDAKVFKDPATASENAVGQIARDLCAGPKLRSVEIRSKNGQITIVDSEVPAVKRKSSLHFCRASTHVFSSTYRRHRRAMASYHFFDSGRNALPSAMRTQRAA